MTDKRKPFENYGMIGEKFHVRFHPGIAPPDKISEYFHKIVESYRDHGGDGQLSMDAIGHEYQISFDVSDDLRYDFINDCHRLFVEMLA